MPNQFTNVPSRSPIFPIGPSTAYIPLTKGLFAVVDTEDASNVAQFNWIAKLDKKLGGYYAVRSTPRNGKGTRQGFQSMHRFLAGVDGFSVDHKNPSRTLDNRRANLRQANRFQQMRNQQLREDSRSGFKGVSKSHNKWRARIAVDGLCITLGYCYSAEDAARLYDIAATKHYGEFACLNFPGESR